MMKYLKYIFILLAFMMFTPSCDDGFAELNQNPGAASSISPEFQLSWAQLRTSGGRYENWRAMLIYSSMMNQHMAATCGYWTGDKYTYNAGYSSSLWENGYREQVKDIVDLVNSLEAAGDTKRLAIANIWKVVIFQRLTDMYGDTPYSEAGKGFIDGITKPKYDKQADIYADLLKILEESAAELGDGNLYGNADFVYAGDEASWKRFANSLMLRMAMRMVKVDPAGAEAWAKKALAGGTMSSVDDDAFIAHSEGPDGINRNGIGEVLDKNNGFGDDCPRISATFMGMLEGDPRQSVIAVPADSSGLYTGLPNGLDETTILDVSTVGALGDFSRVNPELVRVSSPMFFMTYSESEFLTAEAVMRGWASGNAGDHYENGVRAAMKLFDKYPSAANIADADIDTYLAANAWDDANGMEILGNEFYKATFLNEYETFSNWRRTGYPELVPVDYPGNESGGTIPRRLRYSLGEYGINPDNIQEAINNQGPDEFTTRVWWDSE